MRTAAAVLVVTACLVVASGCRAAANPDQQLKDSFFQQIQSTSLVHDFHRSGDEVTFSGRYADRPEAKWVVHIDSTAVEHDSDGKTPSKGTIKSTWSVDGQPIRPHGSESDLPAAFLDAGLAQECWALWDRGSRSWSWK